MPSLWFGYRIILIQKLHDAELLLPRRRVGIFGHHVFMGKVLIVCFIADAMFTGLLGPGLMTGANHLCT